MTNTNIISLIRELKKIPSSLSYDGDASIQVLLPTIEGKYLRIGVTDDDVAEHPGKIWFDYYEGFNNEIKNLNRIYCKAKSKANKPQDYKNCNCHNFCKYDNVQFASDLA